MCPETPGVHVQGAKVFSWAIKRVAQSMLAPGMMRMQIKAFELQLDSLGPCRFFG